MVTFFWRCPHRGSLRQNKLSKLFFDMQLHVVICVLEPVNLRTSGKKMHYVLSCDYSDYIIRNVLHISDLYNPNLYDTPHTHVLVHVARCINAIFSDYIIRNML